MVTETLTMSSPDVVKGAFSRTVTGPTPPRPADAMRTSQSESPSILPRSASTSSSSRLIYRGALSLPDSHLVLDGLSFSASGDVLANPLALALESMRGRRSLRLRGLVPLQALHLEYGSGVTVDIHPRATLSRIYFQNAFCYAPLSSGSSKPACPESTKTSEHGIRVALGDNDGPDVTELLIYASYPPLSPDSPDATIELTLSVARLLPGLPPGAPADHRLLHPDEYAQRKRPRPDDAVPRRPPLFAPMTLSDEDGEPPAADPKGKRKAIEKDKPKPRGKAKGKEPETEAVRRAREVMLFGASGKRKRDDSAFKVPALPENVRVDVFGADVRIHAEREVSEMEKSNKETVKRAAIAALARAGIGKTHAEFRVLYSVTWRGTAIAVRHAMQLSTVDRAEAERIADAHVRIYVPDSSTPLRSGGETGEVSRA